MSGLMGSRICQICCWTSHADIQEQTGTGHSRSFSQVQQLLFRRARSRIATLLREVAVYGLLCTRVGGVQVRAPSSCFSIWLRWHVGAPIAVGVHAGMSSHAGVPALMAFYSAGSWPGLQQLGMAFLGSVHTGGAP